MFNTRILVAFILITFLSIDAQSQDNLIHSQFYGIDEGFSHRNVQSIYQDQQGFMWFGTQYGLNRFDGYDFEWFTEEKNGLQNNEVNHIIGDTNGQMWLFHTGALLEKKVQSIDLFDPVSQTVASFEETFGDSAPFAENKILCFGTNKSGHLVFVTENQLVTYTNEFESYAIDLAGIPIIQHVTWATDGRFWITAYDEKLETTLFILDKKGNLLNQHNHHPSSHLYIYGMEENSRVKYFDYSSKNHRAIPIQFYEIDSNGQQHVDSSAFRVFSSYANEITKADPGTLIKNHQGHYWFYTSHSQFYLHSTESEQFTILSDKYPALKNTTAIFSDREGATWVSTQSGVYRFKLQAPLFKKLMHDRIVNVNGKPFSCRSLKITPAPNDQSAGTLWAMVENHGGIWQVDLLSGEEKQFLRIEGTRYAMGKNAENHLLYPTSETIHHIDPNNGQLVGETRYKHDGESVSIWAIHVDKYGKTWYNNQANREMRYNENGQITVFDNWLNSDEKHFVYQFHEEQSDTVWVVTNSGLVQMDIRDGKILHRYWEKGSGSYHLPYDNIHHLHKDRSGIYWLATAGTGLLKWHPDRGIIERFTRADGLPNNTVYAIYEDRHNNLWMSTANGIAVLNKSTKQIRGYREKDGLTHHEFNRISHCSDEAGNIYFGSLNGVTAFHPDDFYRNSSTSQPPLVITQFQQFDNSQDKLEDKTAALRKTNLITMTPDDHLFRMEFALLVFEGTEHVQYAYLVEGVDKDWVYQKENSLRFSRLPYGTHVLRIKGQSANGQWSENELAIKVEVLKPFYLQGWFLFAALILLIAAIILFSKVRTRRLEQQKLLLEKEVANRTETISQQTEELLALEKLKSRFFANVSHELRTPLTLILGPIQSILKRKKGENDEVKLLRFVQRNGLQLQKLVNEILDLSKLEDNRLEIQEEPVVFFQYLNKQLAQFYSAASSNRRELEFVFLADQSIQIFLDEKKFEKILHNYLSNAIKFTPPKGHVKLTVEKSGDQFIVSVKDTGRGIHPEDLLHVFDRFYQSKQANFKTEGGTGIGLSLVKELAELLGGKVWAESELGKGSTFYYQFPIKLADAIKIETKKTQKKQALITPIPHKPANTPQSLSSVSPLSTILIVEDNPDLREYLQFLLSNYQILVAKNGKQALETLVATDRQQTVDLIISDLMMPIMNGFLFLENIKNDDRWRHIPTIMLTAKTNTRTKLKALRIGVDDYLTKPFQENELKARIENLLRNYRERMAAFATLANADTPNDKNIIPFSQPVIAATDAAWLEEVENLFLKHLSDNRLNLKFAADKLYLSERHFSRRIKQITGLTANQYLQELRLQQAKDWLIVGKFGTVKETAFAVGFSDVRYFSKLFEKNFGVKPSEIR